MNGLIPQFCSQVADGKAKKKTLTNKDFKKPNKVKRTPPVSSTQFDGYKFNFGYTGGKDCKKSCSDAFSGILGPCNPGTTILSKGSLNTGCGTYSYSIDNPPPPPPPKQTTCEPHEYPWGACTTDCVLPDTKYAKSAYQAASHQFCYGGYGWVAKPRDIW